MEEGGKYLWVGKMANNEIEIWTIVQDNNLVGEISFTKTDSIIRLEGYYGTDGYEVNGFGLEGNIVGSMIFSPERPRFLGDWKVKESQKHMPLIIELKYFSPSETE